MRLRNITGAKEKIEKSKYIVLNPETYKGKYKNLFNNDNPIYIEIGMGKGSFIIGNATKYPNINFIGIEKYDSVILKATQSLENLDLPNLKLIRFDATNINDIFDKEIDLVYLNFSDPWPKNRHEHRRLTSEAFLKRYDGIFKGDSKITMKTDNRKLFEFSIISLTNYGYTLDNLSLNLYDDDIKDNIPTEYETKFHSLGYPIYRFEASKKTKSLHVK